VKGGLSVNDFDKNNWLPTFFLVACGLFFFGCVWYLWVGALNPDYHWQPSPAVTAEPADRILEQRGRILLAKDHGARVGDSRIVYRGSRSGILHMDLYILQLDPHFGYPHRIDADQARKGFRMGEHFFQVLAASDGKISLKRL